MTQGIYLIVNTVNDKYYIGSAVNIENRWSKHISLLSFGIHDNRHLQSAWNKYGIESFGFSVLEEVQDKSRLIEREQFWLDYTKCYHDEIGYNIRSKAESQLGIKWSKESREKARNNQTGRKYGEETKVKLSKISIERQKLKPTNRKKDKWPCPKGKHCKCERCIIQHREYHRNYMRKRSAAKKLAK